MTNAWKLSLFFLLAGFIFNPFSSAAQSDPRYDQAWEQVDSLALEGLPRSALRVVEEIYARARTEENTAMQVKGAIHRMLFVSYTEEDSFDQVITGLRTDLQKSDFPVKQVLHSLLAETYWKFYQQNRYRFFQRSTVADTVRDFRNWDYERLLREVIHHYQHSLEDPGRLQETTIAILAGALNGDTATRSLRPTLYDLLTQRAVSFYTQEESNLQPKPEVSYLFDQPSLFADAATFAHRTLPAHDSLFLALQALHLFQQLTLFHLEDKNPAALVDVTLMRLKYVHGKSLHPHRDSLYVGALEELRSRYIQDPVFAEISYALANFHFENNQVHVDVRRGRPYLSSGRDDPSGFIKAMQACQEALERHPDSFGAKNCLALRARILKKDLELKAEKVNLPEEPFRILLRYRNLQEVWIRIVSVSRDEIDSVGILTWQYDPGIAAAEEILLGKPPLLEYQHALPGTEDFYMHSTELGIDALPPGNYAIIASGSENFHADSAGLKYTFVQMSNLSVFRRSNDQMDELYVTDRKTGTPLPEMTLELFKQQNEKGTLREVRKKVLKSDRQGKYHMRLKGPASYHAHVFTEKDTLTAFENRWIGERSGKVRGPATEERTVFFTDRSVYRPGQTVHFKGFMLLSDEKSRIWPNEATEVTFYDVNDEEIASLELISNEFGTFSGTFIIPQNVLPGTMSIENEWGDTRIEVAEYKRPTFEVNFEPVTEIFRINDSILVRGNAKSFSGYAIDRAQVLYTVTRTGGPAILRHRMIYPPEPPLQVASGKLDTDPNGNFSITFAAEARDTSQNYSFQVSADVTDLNGETRSGSTFVNVGNKNLLITATIGEEVFSGNSMEFEVGARNLNGEFQDSELKITVHALEAPGVPLRERVWEAPDQYVMSKEEFKKSFPIDVYAQEDDPTTWNLSKTCFQLDLRTDSMETVNLSPLNQCASGRYVMEIRARTRAGDTSRERYYFHFQLETPGMPQTASDFIKVLKNSGAPGDSAEFLIGTGSAGSRVLYEIITEAGRKEERWVELGEIQKKITLPLHDGLQKGAAVQFTLVHENRIYRRLEPVFVEVPKPDLGIRILSFRDQLLPGEQEQWTIQITRPGNEKVMAELAATLYDASLDDILPHSWPVHQFGVNSYFNYHAFIWNTGQFGDVSRNGRLRDFKTGATETLHRSYEMLEMFGFDNYGSFNHSYRNYVRQLQEKKRLAAEQQALESAFKSQSLEVGTGRTVKGTVRDEQGNPVPGVSVHVKGTRTAVASTSQGHFKILVPENGILVFALIGFKNLEMEAGDEKTLNVTLVNDPASLDEVVVLGYGSQMRKAVTGSIMIRGVAAGVQVAEAELAETVEHDASGTNLQSIVPRKNFNETAFFYPQLQTDEDGMINLKFTMPESITRWNLLAFAHTKDLRYVRLAKKLVTRKEVSVSANAPRFVRTGDRISFTAKVVNLTAEALKGDAILELRDALSLQPLDSLLLQETASRKFQIDPGSSQVITWELRIPENLEALSYRVLANAGRHSDGEENTIPVLPNRVLVTETLPLEIAPGQTQEFSIDRFAGRQSTTAQPYRLTLEYTANPAWYAVQALPYLMEFPYECSEQLFSRYFANSLASTIMRSSPRIKAIFDQWRDTDSDELLSALEKNQELKSALLEETPWVLQSRNDSERKKRLALLFDLNHMDQQNRATLKKLRQMQLPDGSFPWFSGMPGSRFITQHILMGIGQMDRLQALSEDEKNEIGGLIRDALRYVDNEVNDEYQRFLKRKEDPKNAGATDQLNAFLIQYLYMRSFFPDHEPGKETQTAIDFYLDQTEAYWLVRPVSLQGMMALVMHRSGRLESARKILRSLKERAQYSEDAGMYWAENRRGYTWHEAPIETQALLIEVFTEITESPDDVELLKKWLLRQKRTTNWQSTKATVAACYAILLRGTDWLTAAEESTITLGGTALEVLKPGLKSEAGTGYRNVSWEASEITSAMEEIRITNPGKVSSWGALYWQYFEKPAQIAESGEGLRIRKTIYKEMRTESGPVLVPLEGNQSLKPGDLVKIRLEVQADRDYEYVHLKDLRAAAFEPVEVMARYRHQDGLGYYQAIRDASMNFFINHLPRGSYILEYALRVTHSGEFSNGFATLQCMYAPEFSARSRGQSIQVD